MPKGRVEGQCQFTKFQSIYFIISNVLATLDPGIKFLIHITGYTTVTFCFILCHACSHKDNPRHNIQVYKTPQRVKHVAELSIER